MRLRGDKELMSLVMSSVRSSYVFLKSSKELQSDPEFIKNAVSYNGYLLEAIYDKSETLWDDEETVFSGIKNVLQGGRDGYYLLKFVSARLLHSELFAHRMLSIYPKGRLQFDSPGPFRLSKFRDNKELMLSLILKSDTSHSFDSCSPRLRSDKEMLLAALSCGNYTGVLLHYASAELRLDEEIVRLALHRSWREIEFVHPRFQSDKSIMLAQIKSLALGGTALYFASDELKADKEIVLAAIQTGALDMRRIKTVRNLVGYEWYTRSSQGGYNMHGLAPLCCPLCYASSELQSDKDVVLAAFRTMEYSKEHMQYPWSSMKFSILECMSPMLLSDTDVALEYLKRFRRLYGDTVWCYEDPEFKHYKNYFPIQNKEFMLHAISSGVWKKDFSCLSWIKKHWGPTSDPEIVLAAMVAISSDEFMHASIELRSDVDFLLRVIDSFHSGCIPHLLHLIERHASSSARLDPRLVFRVLEKDPATTIRTYGSPP